MNSNKPIEILTFVVAIAAAIVELNELWKKIEPDVKRVINPLMDAAKDLASGSNKKLAIAKQ